MRKSIVLLVAASLTPSTVFAGVGTGRFYSAAVIIGPILLLLYMAYRAKLIFQGNKETDSSTTSPSDTSNDAKTPDNWN